MSRTLSLIVIVILASTISMHPSSAQSSQGITIHPDGSITPTNAPIQIEGNIYVLTANINTPITVERVGINFDGANHTIQGPGKDQNQIAITLTAWNVTIQNMSVTGWRAGVYGAFDNNTIKHCIFTNNSQSIAIYGGDYVIQENYITSSSTAILINSNDNLITQNQVKGNTWAFDILKSNNTTIAQNNATNNEAILVIATYTGHNILYNNNFIDNTQPLLIPFGGPTLRGITPISPAGLWDNGHIGNYWSDYATRYPNATETDKTGIGNTPYHLEYSTSDTITYANGTQDTQTVTLGTAVDHYPLVAPISFTFNSNTKPTATPHQTTQTPIPTNSPLTSTTPIPTPTISMTFSQHTPSPSIPEFPSWTIRLVIAVLTLVVALAVRREKTR